MKSSLHFKILDSVGTRWNQLGDYNLDTSLLWEVTLNLTNENHFQQLWTSFPNTPKSLRNYYSYTNKIFKFYVSLYHLNGNFFYKSCICNFTENLHYPWKQHRQTRRWLFVYVKFWSWNFIIIITSYTYNSLCKIETLKFHWISLLYNW